MITTSLEDLFSIFGSRLLGGYWFRYEVCEGIDQFPGASVFHVKGIFVPVIMGSTIVTPLAFIKSCQIICGQLIKCPKNFFTRGFDNACIKIKAITTLFVADHPIIPQRSSPKNLVIGATDLDLG